VFIKLSLFDEFCTWHPKTLLIFDENCPPGQAVFAPHLGQMNNIMPAKYRKIIAR
jgi:hypothetical protein